MAANGNATDDGNTPQGYCVEASTVQGYRVERGAQVRTSHGEGHTSQVAVVGEPVDEALESHAHGADAVTSRQGPGAHAVHGGHGEHGGHGAHHGHHVEM